MVIRKKHIKCYNSFQNKMRLKRKTGVKVLAISNLLVFRIKHNKHTSENPYLYTKRELNDSYFTET